MYYFYNVSGLGKLVYEFSTSNKEYAEQQIEVRKNLGGGGYAIRLPNHEWIEI